MRPDLDTLKLLAHDLQFYFAEYKVSIAMSSKIPREYSRIWQIQFNDNVGLLFANVPRYK